MNIYSVVTPFSLLLLWTRKEQWAAAQADTSEDQDHSWDEWYHEREGSQVWQGASTAAGEEQRVDENTVIYNCIMHSTEQQEQLKSTVKIINEDK